MNAIMSNQSFSFSYLRRRAVAVIAALLIASPGLAQVFPLSENSWSNPEFVERFLGSYGMDTDVEPKQAA